VSATLAVEDKAVAPEMPLQLRQRIRSSRAKPAAKAPSLPARTGIREQASKHRGGSLWLLRHV